MSLLIAFIFPFVQQGPFEQEFSTTTYGRFFLKLNCGRKCSCWSNIRFSDPDCNAYPDQPTNYFRVFNRRSILKSDVHISRNSGGTLNLAWKSPVPSALRPIYKTWPGGGAVGWEAKLTNLIRDPYTCSDNKKTWKRLLFPDLGGRDTMMRDWTGRELGSGYLWHAPIILWTGKWLEDAQVALMFSK